MVYRNVPVVDDQFNDEEPPAVFDEEESIKLNIGGKYDNLEWARAIVVTALSAAEDDDVDEYTENQTSAQGRSTQKKKKAGERSSRRKTPVVCSPWSCLGMVVVLGMVLFANIPSFRDGDGATTSSMFSSKLDADTISNVEDLFHLPDGHSTCVKTSNGYDGQCQVIMDSLEGVLSKELVDLMNIKGTCQWGARSWLRSNKDILMFTKERIQQRYALSVFYCEMNGISWLEDSNYLGDLHECDWYNKMEKDSCNEMEQLIILRLNDNSLQGTIPKELPLVLTNLNELTLSGNLIHGTIPSELTKLTALDTFDIHNNFITGQLPSFIFDGQMSHLVYIDISQNYLSGSIVPSNVLLNETLPNLEVLFADSNKLVGTIPESIGNLERLKKGKLDLYTFRHLSRPRWCVCVCVCVYLSYLDLRIQTNNIYSVVRLLLLSFVYFLFLFVCIYNIVHLNDNQLTGTIPQELLLKPNNRLVSLHLQNNQLNGELPSDLFVTSSDIKEIILSENPKLHGHVSDETCMNLIRSDSTAQQQNVDIFEVDCNHIKCNCCTCVTKSS